MIINRTISLAVIIFLLAKANTGLCQSEFNLRFDYITVNDDLSHSDVTKIVQDTLGYLWFGTNSGLNRYDGKHLRVFKQDFANDQSLPDNRITELFLDGKGKLWIGTESGGLCWYDYTFDRFVKVPLPTNLTIRNSISAILEDNKGRLWVGTNYDGLFRLNQTKDETYAKHFYKQEACKNCLPTNNIISLFVRDNGELLVGTNQGLVVIKNDSIIVPVASAPLRKLAIHCFYPMERSLFLLATSAGLYEWSTAGGLRKVGQNEIAGLDIRDIFKDKQGRIWLASFNNGVYVLKGDSIVHNYRQNLAMPGRSINYNRVNAFYEDSFGTLWFGTSGGGANYTSFFQLPFSHVFKNPNKSNQIVDNYVTALDESNSNTLWVGTRKGLSIYDLLGEKSINFSFSPELKDIGGNFVSDILTESKSGNWILIREGGLSQATWQNEKLSFKFVDTKKSSWPNDNFISLAEDDYGRLWIATYNSGIIVYNPFTLETTFITNKNTTEGLPTNLLTFVYKDPYSNTIWLGSRDKGLIEVKIRDEQSYKITNYKSNTENKKSISWNYVWPIIKDKDSTLWVGTIGGGLNKMVRKEKGGIQFKRYDTRHGLPENDVESIQIDDKGNVWIGGYGVTRFNPKTETFENFTVKDGLQSNSFKVGAACKGQSGTLYFGGINGFNSFNPDLIRRSPIEVNIVLTNLFLNNKKVPVSAEPKSILSGPLAHTSLLTLPGYANDVRIDFDVIYTHYGGQVNISYSIEGYFEGWRDLEQSRRSLDLSNLPAGKYVLKLRAHHGSLPVPYAETSLRIIKKPKWWRSNIAIIMYILAIILSYILVRRLTIYQMSIRQNLELANKQKELSLSKIQFFTNISHELRTPLTLILGPLEDIIYKSLQPSQIRSSVQIIHKNAQRLMTLVNILLDFRKIENGQLSLIMAKEDLSIFVQELFLVFKAKAEEKQIRFTLHLPDEPLLVCFDKIQLEIVLTNLISNAFKFTKPNGIIELNVKLVGNPKANALYDDVSTLIDNYVTIKIKDSGIGMTAEELTQIFDRFYQVRKQETLSIVGSGIGLSFSKEIIDLHKGNIEVTSEPGKGSEFLIKLPLGTGHLDEQQIVVHQVRDFEQNDHHDMEGSSFFNDYIKEIDRKGTINILLIDDNADILAYLKNSLKEYYKVFTAVNGKEGFEQLQKNMIHLIICDVIMPVMDGVAFTKKVKESRDYGHIPLILLTAKTAAINEMEGLEAGADDYISKPFSVRLLLTKLESLLKRQQNIKDYYHNVLGLTNEPINGENLDSGFLNKAIHIIDTLSEDESFNVNVLANELAMSRSALYKKIKEISGKSAVEFIRDIKISKAGKLLKTGDYRVKEVANKVGFKDIKYFRDCFIKQFGMTPSDFVKNLKKEK